MPIPERSADREKTLNARRGGRRQKNNCFYEAAISAGKRQLHSSKNLLDDQENLPDFGPGP